LSLSDLDLESIQLPIAVVKCAPNQLAYVNPAFRLLIEDHSHQDEDVFFEDIDALLDGGLTNLDGNSHSLITQELKIGRKRFSFEFRVGITTQEKFKTVTIIGVDKSDALKTEAKLNSYVRIIEENNKELQRLANTDSLTETANRRALFDTFDKLLQRVSDFHCTVSILDIDYFKRYNDQYGHDFGDFVLKTFARQIQDHLSEKTIFARIGGEEFCLVDYSGSATTATDKLQTTLNTVRNLQLQTPKTESVNISFSAGVAKYGIDGKTLDELLKNADRALYYAKANGRSCVIPYSADLFEKRDTTLIAQVDSPIPSD